MNQTDNFLSSILEVSKNQIPKHVIQRAYWAMLDYIAVTAAGSKENEEFLRQYMLFAEPEMGGSTLIGMHRKTNLKEAVFLNGLNAHTLDFDDGTNTGIIHLGSVIFSVLLPLAEKYKVNVDKLLKSAVIGYETAFTMAISIQPKHKLMGYHATGTCGILGSTIAAAYMLDFSETESKNAFAIAAVSASGMLKVVDDESELKPYNVAKSALLGLVAVQMAKAGKKGNVDPLGGDRGYLKMMTGVDDVRFENVLMNGTYAIEKAYIKPYAACRYCHPAIEAAISVGNGIDLSKIKNINVRTYDLAVKGHDHIEIPGKESAKMSIPYGVAVGIVNGKAGMTEYKSDHISDIRVLDLAKKVTVRSDSAFSAAFPQKQIASVEIELISGSKLEKCVDFPKGEPENPMSWEEFQERFYELLSYAGIEKDVEEKIITRCSQYQTFVSDVCALL